jgi:hypothetical protein
MKRTGGWLGLALLLGLSPPLPAAEPRHCPKPLEVCVAEQRQHLAKRGVLGFLLSESADGVRVPGHSGESHFIVRAAPPGYPAYTSGLREGDFLLAMDGKDLAGVPRERLLEMNAAVVPRQTVAYRILRAGSEREVRITAASPTRISIDAWVGEHVRGSHRGEDYRRYLLQLKASEAHQ